MATNECKCMNRDAYATHWLYIWCIIVSVTCVSIKTELYIKSFNSIASINRKPIRCRSRSRSMGKNRKLKRTARFNFGETSSESTMCNQSHKKNGLFLVLFSVKWLNFKPFHNKTAQNHSYIPECLRKFRIQQVFTSFFKLTNTF